MIKLQHVSTDPSILIKEMTSVIFPHPDFILDRFNGSGQIALKYSPEVMQHHPHVNLWECGIGTLSDWDNCIPVTTEMFDTIHPALKGSYFEEVIQLVTDHARKYGDGIGRVRLMRLKPRTCYTLHMDPEEFRYHIPLITNDQSFFVVGDCIDRMKYVGQLYTLRTKEMHTAVNASYINRDHLVFDTYPLQS